MKDASGIFTHLQMARMEIDCNLKKIPQVLQILPVYFEEIAKN